MGPVLSCGQGMCGAAERRLESAGMGDASRAMRSARDRCGGISVASVVLRRHGSVKDALVVADLQRMAKRRVPRMFFDYVDGGSNSESTLDANGADFQQVLLRQRVAVDITFIFK